MKRLFERISPILIGLFMTVLAAKLSALFVDVFLPPVPTLECRIQSAHTKEHYPFAKAFGLKSTAHKPGQTVRHAPQISLKGYELSMTAVGKPSMAIIVHHGKSKLLTVGESIDGFRLSEVYTDRVKLIKSGREYWLSMKKAKSSATVAKSAGKERVKPSDLAEQIRQEGDTYYIPRELLDEMHDVKKIFKFIAIKPIYRDNKLIGFGVSSIKKGSVFDKMGLRKRDIIEKINGNPLSSETDAFKYFNKINELSALTLTIKRGSERKELHYEIF